MSTSFEQAGTLVQHALHVYKEAVQLFIDKKESRAFYLLHAEDGSFCEAINSDDVAMDTKEWLQGIRSALCRDLY